MSEKYLISFCPRIYHVLYILTSMWVLCTPNAGRNLHFQCFFLGIIHSTSVLVQTQKNHLLQMLQQISLFLSFSAFKHKKHWNEDFNQPLECAAPKCWSKYTTIMNLVEFIICFCFVFHLFDCMSRMVICYQSQIIIDHNCYKNTKSCCTSY